MGTIYSKNLNYNIDLDYIRKGDKMKNISMYSSKLYSYITQVKIYYQLRRSRNYWNGNVH